jgi:hypothetical protein
MSETSKELNEYIREMELKIVLMRDVLAWLDDYDHGSVVMAEEIFSFKIDEF